MKRLVWLWGVTLAMVLGASSAVAGQNLGFLDSGIGISFHELGAFTDTATLAQATDGSAVITFNGGETWRCTGGRGGGNCFYNVSQIDSVSIADASGNVLCTSSARATVTVSGGSERWTLTCSIATLPAGFYTVTLTGRGYAHTKIPGSEHDSDEPYSVVAQHQ